MSDIFAYGYRYGWSTVAGVDYLERNLCTYGSSYYNSTWESVKTLWGWRNGSSTNSVGGNTSYFGNIQGSGQNLIYGVRFLVKGIKFSMKCHTINGSWVEVSSDENNYDIVSFLPTNSPIDGIMVRITDGMDVQVQRVFVQSHLNGGSSWLSPISGYNEHDSQNGYSGVLGRAIDGIRVFITFSYQVSPPEPDPPEENSGQSGNNNQGNEQGNESGNEGSENLEETVCPNCGSVLVNGECPNDSCENSPYYSGDMPNPE